MNKNGQEFNLKARIKQIIVLAVILILAFSVSYALDLIEFQKIKKLQDNIYKYDIVVSSYDYANKKLKLDGSLLVKMRELIFNANQGKRKDKKSYDYSFNLTIYNNENIISEIILHKDSLNSTVVITGNIEQFPISAHSYDNNNIIVDLYNLIPKQ